MAREAAKIKIYSIKRAFGKWVTIVQGITKEANPRGLAKKLKSALACGGTFKQGKIELQGEHRKKVRELLLKEGFTESQIELE
jgi:translation initiation factor 1